MIDGSSAARRFPSTEQKRGSADAKGAGSLNGIDVRQLATGDAVPSHKKAKSEASGLTSMFRKLADFTVTLGGPDPKQLARRIEGQLSQALPGIGASLRNQVLEHGGFPKNGQEAAEKVRGFLSTVNPSPADKMSELTHWAKQLGIAADAKSLLLVFEDKHGANTTFEKFASSLPEFFRTYEGKADHEFNAKAGQIRSTGDSQIADHMRKVNSKQLTAHQNASVSADTKSKPAKEGQTLPKHFSDFFKTAEDHALTHFRAYCVREDNHENIDFLLENRTIQRSPMSLNERLKNGRDLLIRHPHLSLSSHENSLRSAIIAGVPEKEDQIADLPELKKDALLKELQQLQQRLERVIGSELNDDAYARYATAEGGRYPPAPPTPDLVMIS